MPTAQPQNRAHRWNQRVYSAKTSAGMVCRIHTPPSSWKLIASCASRPSTNANAPNFTTSDINLLCRASWLGVASGLMYSLYTLRVHRFAAAIDMIAAGISAPIAIAANATPANQLENSWSKSAGTDCCGLSTLMPAAMAAKPSSASRPSRNEYAGRRAALRLITERFFEASTPVSECGYMNSASAEPSARDAYPHCAAAGGMIPLADAVPAAMASALSVLNASNEFFAAAKMLSHPPSCVGR